MSVKDEDRTKQEAQAQLESIVEMVNALEVDYDRLEELQAELTEAHVGEDTEKSFDDWLKDQSESEDGTFKDSASEYIALAFDAGDCGSLDDAQDAIRQNALSVQIRTGWYAPGAEPEPEEFEILLSTGGPACRIIGELDMHLQPDKARLEYQDWGTPWTELHDLQGNRDTLLTYCNQFYFGE